MLPLQTLAWLGWVAGPILIAAFYLVTVLTSTLLASVYEVKGVRHRRYKDAVKAILVGVAVHAAPQKRAVRM